MTLLMLYIYNLARPRAPGPMRGQLGPQASMQMRRGMPRGMAPTRNVGPSPQATVHRPGGEVVHPARPKARRPPESSMQRKPAAPTEGMFGFKKNSQQIPEILNLPNKNSLSFFIQVTGFSQRQRQYNFPSRFACGVEKVSYCSCIWPL